ncbi:MAG: RluA family pseudouridine synthase [Lachnospiraceae bacterium]|nr:RluA family pseudouridine synthase [Lachnospiraceae bacterium]
MKRIDIDSSNEGGRFDKFLIKHLPGAGTSFIYKMLRKKNITLNKKKAAGNEILKAGDFIEIFFSDDTYEKFRKSDNRDSSTDVYISAFNDIKDVEVLYEDKDVVILNKPIGVLSQKAADKDISLNEWLIGYLLDNNEVTNDSLKDFKPSVCNRLDRNTAGIVLCGKSIKGSRALSKAIKERKIDKYYVTLVKGIGLKEGEIKGSLVKDEKANKVKVNLNEGDEIRTYIKPISENDRLSYLEILLYTGKTHQIRATLAALSHPLVGDYKYGNKALNDKFKEEYGLEAQFLACNKVVFPKSFPELENLSGKVIKASLPKLYETIIHKEKL